jgi:thymidylate synthase
MNNIDKKYTELLQDIIHNGVEKKDRTGTGTISVFGRQIRHKMSEGFPLLTTKKLHWRSIVTELLWFLRGDTNIKYLVDNGCHIWDGDAYKNYCKNVPNEIINTGDTFIDTKRNLISTCKRKEIGTSKKVPILICEYEGCYIEEDCKKILTQDKFINFIKTDDEFAKKWGELGPIYGKQWRSWGMFAPFHTVKGIDQIANLISELKTNPDSRRLMVNAYNVGELDQMVLPPCHYGFQVYTRELSVKERLFFVNKSDEEYEKALANKEQYESIGLDFELALTSRMNELNIPTRAISLMWNQRSVDTFLGLPFNIASYGLLLEIIAREVNMIPDELIGNLGDVHLYSNHIEQAKEQIGREYTEDERIEFLQKTGMDALVDGKRQEFMEANIPKRTRQPFELPTITITERNWYQHEKVKEHLGEKTFIQKIESYRPEDFTLNNYQSHPAIKAKLSN